MIEREIGGGRDPQRFLKALGVDQAKRGEKDFVSVPRIKKEEKNTWLCGLMSLHSTEELLEIYRSGLKTWNRAIPLDLVGLG